MTTSTAVKKPMTKLMPRLVANDNGYAAHKIAWLDANGNILTGKIPSQIQVGGGGFSNTTGGRVGAYVVEGVEYHCSSILSSPMNLRNADYPVSVANRVLFNHALASFGLLGMPIKAAVTLPFRDYYNADGSINEVLKAKTEHNFVQRNVEVVDSDAQPDVQGIRVCTEALSAWFDWAMNDDGSMTPAYNELHDMDGEMLVVDIGGSTTDLASLGLVGGQLLINQQKSGTERAGVLDALGKLEELVRAKMEKEGVQGVTGHGGTLPQKLLDLIMEKGSCNYAGRAWSFEPERDMACKVVAERVVSFIKSKAGNPGSYFAIQIVGGGAIVFRRWIEAMFNNAVFGDEFSNARGALKYMRGAE